MPEDKIADVSDTVEGNSVTPPEKTTEVKRTVSWDDHQRAIKDMHKFKAANVDAEKRLAVVEEDRLKEKSDWKALAEREKTRADKLEVEKKSLSEVFTKTQKYSEIRKSAMEAGLRPEAMDDLDLIDVDGVQVEATSSGRFIVHGSKEFIEELKTKKPHWFKKGTVAEINSGGINGGLIKSTKLGPLDVFDAEKKWKAGKISRQDYLGVFEKYRTQKN